MWPWIIWVGKSLLCLWAAVLVAFLLLVLIVWKVDRRRAREMAWKWGQATPHRKRRKR